jgi:hypothetical protein
VVRQGVASMVSGAAVDTPLVVSTAGLGGAGCCFGIGFPANWAMAATKRGLSKIVPSSHMRLKCCRQRKFSTVQDLKKSATSRLIWPESLLGRPLTRPPVFFRFAGWPSIPGVALLVK